MRKLRLNNLTLRLRTTIQKNYTNKLKLHFNLHHPPSLQHLHIHTTIVIHTISTPKSNRSVNIIIRCNITKIHRFNKTNMYRFYATEGGLKPGTYWAASGKVTQLAGSLIGCPRSSTTLSAPNAGTWITLDILR